jgi:hypothetical protein
MDRSIQEHYTHRPPGTFITNELQRSALYLLRVQNADGSWGNPAVFETGMSLLALGLWRARVGTSELDDTLRHASGRAFDWLRANQHGGTWGNNIWDAAMVVRCAALFERLDDPFTVKTLDWLESQETDSWGLGNLGPHYAAQALLAFCAASQSSGQEKLSTLLYQYLLSTPITEVEAYQLSQVVEALLRAGLDPNDPVISNVIEQLSKVFNRTHVSFANLVETCAIMTAISSYSDSIRHEYGASQRVVAEMISPSRRLTNGSWYDNTLTTAFATIALSQAHEPTIVEATPAEIAAITSAAKRRILADVSDLTADRRRIAIRSGVAGCLAAAVTTSTAIGLGVTLDGRLIGSEASWGVTGLLAAAFTLAVTGLGGKLRHRR